MPRKTPNSAVTEEADLNILLYHNVEMPENWKQLGSCWETENLLFFGPDTTDMRQVAEDICYGSCSVRLVCLFWSLGIDNPKARQREGVWGGYLPEEREIIRRKFLDRRVRMRLEEQRASA